VRLVVRVVVVVAVALADRQRVVFRLAATLCAAPRRLRTDRAAAQTPSNTRRAAAGRAAISQLQNTHTPERTLSRVNGSTDAHDDLKNNMAFGQITI
jgi:hypothetical protein